MDKGNNYIGVFRKINRPTKGEINNGLTYTIMTLSYVSRNR